MDAEPGLPGNPVELTDPKMMRALAHQARIAIWMHLGLHGPATATECAEIAGLSPSACSYHLRTLARYGFVEEDPASAADGRERPWRARLLAFNIGAGPGAPAATQVASRLLVENMRAAAEEVRAQYLARQSEYPADWQAAAGELFSVAHVTPEELDRMRAQVLEVMAPYIRLDPASRRRGAAGPDHARPVPVVRSRGGPGRGGEHTGGGPVTGGWRSGPLAVRSFRLLCGGQFASTIGDYCYAVALPWLVLSAHGGAILLGIVLACYGVPRTVLIPVGGVLADKAGPRTVMLAADAARCVLVAGLAVLAARQIVSLAALGPIAALIGAGEGLFIPASFAIMPSLLNEDRLAAGNALSTAAVQAGSLLGPALGGALVAATRSSTAAFAVDAASFGVSALTLLLIPRRPADGSVAAEAATEAEAEPGGAGGGVLALLRRSRELQVILVVVIAANLASGGMGDVALPALAHASFGAAGYGALLACFAVGGIAGTLGAARTGNLRAPAMFASAVFLVEAAAIALIPFLGGRPARRPRSAWSAPATAWATSPC